LGFLWNLARAHCCPLHMSSCLHFLFSFNKTLLMLCNLCLCPISERCKDLRSSQSILRPPSCNSRCWDLLPNPLQEWKPDFPRT
jgi:hypothetical protein